MPSRTAEWGRSPSARATRGGMAGEGVSVAGEFRPGDSAERLAPHPTNQPLARLDDRYELTDRTGLSLGPIPYATLQNLIRQGRLFRTDRICKNGQLPQALGELLEFEAVFREVLPLEFHVDHNPIRPRPDLAGTLDRIALAEVFIRLLKEKRTGRLFLASPDRKGDQVIIFRSGMPVNAMSNVAEEQLGALLIDQGLINRDTFDQAVEIRRQKGSRIGSALVAIDAISPRDLHRTLAKQAMERLLRAFRQHAGTFHFVSDDTAAQEDILLFADPREIVEAGLHASLAPTEVAEELKAYGDPVLQTRARALDEDWARALTDDDRQVVEALRQPQPLGGVLPKIARTLKLTTEETRLRLLTLLKLGVIAVGEESIADLEETLARLQGLDRFQVLGVGRSDETAKVQAAYQERLDKLGALAVPGDSPAVTRLRERIKQLLDQAAQTLADPDERAMYDRALMLGLDFEQPEARQRLEYDHFLGRGRALLTAQRYAEARECFVRAAERMADEPMVYVQLGWAQFLASNRDTTAAREAVRQAERALKLASDLDQAYLTIGKIYRLAGTMQEAEANLRKAVELNPNNSEAQSELRLIFTRDINASRRSNVTISVGGPVLQSLVVAFLLIGGLFYAANFVPGGATEYPDLVSAGASVPRSLTGEVAVDPKARMVPPEQQRIGNQEYFYFSSDFWWWARRGALLLIGLIGVFAIARQKPKDLQIFGPNASWVFAALPYGVAVGFLSPVQVVLSPPATVLGMTFFHVLAEQVFFIWFLCRTLTRNLGEPAAGVALTAALFGVYHLTYMHIFGQPSADALRDVAQIGAFAGGAYAVLAWRSGGLAAPLLAHLAVNGTMMIRTIANQSH